MDKLFSRTVVFRTVAVAFCLLAGIHCRHQPPLVEADSGPQGEVRISLDMIPMVGEASFVSLEGDRAEVFRHSRSRLTVVGTGQGTVPEGSLRRIAEVLRSPAISAALRRRSFAGEGLSRGDQFHLWVAVPVEGESFGFAAEAPSEVRHLIRDLLRVADDLDEAPLAASYVRSEAIESQRAHSLRSTLDFRALREVPPDLRPSLTRAIERPRSFVALRPSQSDRFFEWSGRRHQSYVTTGKGDYELTLYQGRTTSVPPGTRCEQNR